MTAIPAHDSLCDIADNWREETGDEDASVIAYFSHETREGYSNDPAAPPIPFVEATLTHISVEDGSDERLYSRDQAIGLLGHETVRRIETIHGEAMTGEM